MKIALIRCQEHDYSYQQWFEDVPIGVIASLLDKDSIGYSIFDFALKPMLDSDDYKSNVDKILEIFPNLIIFFIEKLPSNQPIYISTLIKQLKIYEKNWSIHYSVYGVTQPFAMQFLEELPVDSVVIGEEDGLLELVNALSTGQSLESVSGLVYRENNGVVKHNPPKPLSTDLDSLPFPKRYFLESSMVAENTENYVAAMLGSRGCYAKCNFCSLQAFSQFYEKHNWRGRSPKNIVDEMEHLYLENGVREFVFQDMNFFGPGRKGQRRVVEFAQELRERGLEDIAFSLYTRANDVQKDTFELLKAVGLHTVFIGIESFCQAVLDRFDKGMRVEDNLNAIQILKDLDIYLRMGFITFDYYTTFDELRENIRILKDIFSTKGNLIFIPVFFHNIVAPLAGTPLAEQYDLIGAGKDQAGIHYQFESKLVEHQARYSRYGQVTVFQDERIAYVSEAARILSGMAGEKSFYVQDQITKYLFTAVENDDNSKLDKCIEWIDSLMPFVLKEFEALINLLERNDAEDFSKTIEAMELSFDRHDKKFFSLSIPVSNGLWH